MDVTTKVILKAEVCERLRVSDRTLKKWFAPKNFHSRCATVNG